ncbi:hypothetical protein MIR68_011831 [Amoeboaphelidium protococcarum]|nr:hypothetical protein MIR68_011831 [Amoeboaphelidium protococcarum]
MSTLDRYASTDDYIKHVVLGWDVKQEAVDTSRSTNGLLNLFNVNPQDDVATSNSAQQMAFRLVAYRRVESQSLLQQDRLQVILKFNDFPYKFEAGILHYCLWSNQDLSRNFIVEYISEAFDCRVYDMLWFMNPPHKKTIKNVWHVHILLRKRSNDD